MKDLTKPDSPLQTILDDTNSDTWVIDSKGPKLYLVTNLDAPNKRVVTVDASNPEPKNWKDLIPETDNVLSPSTAGGYLFASYIVDALSMVKQYDMDGKFIREIKLPDIGSAYGFGVRKKTLKSTTLSPTTRHQVRPIA